MLQNGTNLKGPVCVGKKINKSASSVTEYDVIDYIQTLNTNKVEGAQADQKLEGRYSNYRHFVEALRDELVKEGLSPNTVDWDMVII